MLCPRCSAPVEGEPKQCPSCKALLPRQAPSGKPAALGLQEGVQYRTPAHHYQSPLIDHLVQLVQGVVEGEDLFEDLEEHMQMLADTIADFEERCVVDMQALLAQESARVPEDQLNAQLSYLLQRGLQLFDEGCQIFEHFFETESEDADFLEAGLLRVRYGYDYLCYSLELARERLVELRRVQALLEKREAGADSAARPL